MPVTTRAGAIRSQANTTTKVILNKATSKRTCGKKTRKCQSQQKQKQVKAQTSRTLPETTACPIVDQQSSISKIEAIVEADSVDDPAEK